MITAVIVVGTLIATGLLFIGKAIARLRDPCVCGHQDKAKAEAERRRALNLIFKRHLDTHTCTPKASRQ
ncbi:hypothetical protein EDD29_0108 [Actinocorallia herbida]|uniref:Uncharacterized protein n=1 Tax=Actinocorallia herbida TaxID=58109 RepID=A0A3N1CMT6_9ACTN|nr:hypothetical protein [Actinocorallia herbida]ROO82627.1 hypothetical protein EDD29_0108 [Actinocorallia herbida]